MHELISQRIIQEILEGKRPKPIALLVDDEKIILDSFSQLLREAVGKFFSIYTFSSGDEALQFIKEVIEKQRAIGLIISDQVMPGMKGDDFLIEAHKLVPDAIKIMLTGMAEGINVGRALNYANLYRYLNKTANDQTDVQKTFEEASKSFFNLWTIKHQERILKSIHNYAIQLSTAQTYARLFELFLHSLGACVRYERAVIAMKGSNGWGIVADTKQNTTVFLEHPTPVHDLTNLHEHLPKLETDSDKILQKNYAIYPIRNAENNLHVLLYLETSNFLEEELRDVETLLAPFAIALNNVTLIENLEDKIAVRTQKLTETLEQLMAVNSHKDKMVQIVSHDIRSPISGVAEIAGFLTNPETASDKDKVMRYAKLIQQEANNVVKFVSDILDLAKLESGTILVNKEAGSLKKFLEQVATRFQTQSIAKQINLELALKEDITCAFDSSKLEQALSNLLSNAFKFTPKGGKVTLGLQKEGVFAKITVSDTGIGVPKEDLPKLFEKFGVKQRKGTSGEKGTGLGMSIAWQIVKLHGGTIEVQSEVQKGTTFTVYIPIEG